MYFYNGLKSALTALISRHYFEPPVLSQFLNRIQVWVSSWSNAMGLRTRKKLLCERARNLERDTSGSTGQSSVEANVQGLNLLMRRNEMMMNHCTFSTSQNDINVALSAVIALKRGPTTWRKTAITSNLDVLELVQSLSTDCEGKRVNNVELRQVQQADASIAKTLAYKRAGCRQTRQIGRAYV